MSTAIKENAGSVDNIKLRKNLLREIKLCVAMHKKVLMFVLLKYIKQNKKFYRKLYTEKISAHLTYYLWLHICITDYEHVFVGFRNYKNTLYSINILLVISVEITHCVYTFLKRNSCLAFTLTVKLTGTSDVQKFFV